MKIAAGIMVFVLIIVDIVLYIQLKKYCKRYENELLDKHSKYIFFRMIWIVVLGILVGVLGVIMQFL